MSEDRTVSINEEEGVIHLQFNRAIIKRFKESNIQMDLMGTVMFVLFGLFEGNLSLLDYADDSNKQRRMQVLYYQLKSRGLLEDDKDGESHFRLTPKGNELVTFLKEQYKEVMKIDVNAETFKPVADVIIEEGEPVGGWIREYVELFPKGRHEGRMLRTHSDQCMNKMNAFMKKYGYDKETILAATKLYIQEQENSQDGHKYTRNANYFISKDSGEKYVSDLATWCERIIDAKKSGTDNMFNPSIMDMV